ncbi:hypothetical protein DV736_g4750, partial [Chaetothyriales sp. CBS 134916]
MSKKAGASGEPHEHGASEQPLRFRFKKHRAFQESLFDALGDDEGADFWQGVYGQPIHNYPNTARNEDTGDLEYMDDEEYAQFVRRKMWEKSPPSESHNNWAFDVEIEASLRRGRRRRDDKRWQGLWADYLQKWQDLRTWTDDRSRNSEKAATSLVLSNQIAWPVESGKQQDLDPDKIEAFFTKAVGAMDTNQDRSDLLHTILKQERVLWHPDKMQQRYGFMQIDEPTMQGITATFQVLDRMWNEAKVSAG